MVLKHTYIITHVWVCFRSMSSQMVLKRDVQGAITDACFRSMSSQMVLKRKK